MQKSTTEDEQLLEFLRANPSLRAQLQAQAAQSRGAAPATAAVDDEAAATASDTVSAEEHHQEPDDAGDALRADTTAQDDNDAALRCARTPLSLRMRAPSCCRRASPSTTQSLRWSGSFAT